MTTALKTEYWQIGDPDDPESTVRLRRAGQCIREGGLVVFPTETVYGLGGDATRPDSARRIYAAKGRPSDNPLIIHINEPAEAEPYAQTCDTYYRLARAFMPGPLTVILPRKETIPIETTGGLETVAVRCPSHPVARALIRLAGTPIAAPSANLSGKPSPTCAAYVREDMDGRVDIVIDGGDCEIGLESTIVAVNGPDSLTLLRPGAVTYDALCMVVSEVKIADAVLTQLREGERVLSPGMKYRHYAPDAPVILLDGDDKTVLDYLRMEQASKCCAILCYDEEQPLLRTSDRTLLYPVGPRDDLAAQAHCLFTLLRLADRQRPDVIYAHLPPKEGLGLALYNRLIRAAAHTILQL